MVAEDMAGEVMVEEDMVMEDPDMVEVADIFLWTLSQY